MTRVLVIGVAVLAVASGACSSKGSSDTESSGIPGVPSPTPQTGAGPTAVGAAVAPAPTALTFAGTYSGSIQGTPASLALERSGDRLTGTIDAQGYRYQVAGTVDGASATGTLTDPQAGANLPFQASASGDSVQLVITAENARLELAFQRAGGAPGVGGPLGAAAGPTGPPPAPAQPSPPAAGANAGQRDQRLVGSWSYNEQLGDGTTGYGVIVWQLIVRPDGTYTYGNDRSQTSGHWRTQGNVVQVSEDGTSWQPHARFITDGGTLMFTLGDGTKQLWRRR